MTLEVYGKSYKGGYVVLANGDTLRGNVRYRRLDVPRKVFFEDTNGKRTYNPRELLSFEREGEVWRSVQFSTQQLGWDDDFFLEQKVQGSGLSLLYGKMTSKGCGCHGVPYSVSREWVLYDRGTGASIIVERSACGRVKNDAGILSFLESSGWDTSELWIQRLEDIVELLRSGDS